MLESIKCSTSGAYYLRGQWVPADAQAPAALAAAGVTAEQAGQAYKGTSQSRAEWRRCSVSWASSCPPLRQ